MVRTGTTVITRKKNSDLQNIVNNRLMMSLCALFLLGMIYGALSVPNLAEELTKSASFITQGFIVSRAEQSIFITLATSFIPTSILLFIIYLMGFSAVGQPISFFIPFFRGLGLGFSMGYFYAFHGVKGIVYCLVLLLPHALLSTLALIIGAKESIRFSNIIFQCFLPKKENQLSLKILKLYTSKYLILILLILLSAVLDCVTTFLFARFFIL